MKQGTFILYTWNETGNIFGLFSSKDEAEKCLQTTADFIHTTVDNLRLDLYIYELPINKPYNS